MAVNKNSQEFLVGVDAGWLSALQVVESYVKNNPGLNLEALYTLLNAAHKPLTTLEEIIANN